MHDATNPLLLAFERRSGLTGMQAATLLGVAKATYYQHRKECSMPFYLSRYVRILMRLPASVLQSLIDEYVDGATL